MTLPYGWCGQQDSNLHAHAMEPKSTESTNSTMPALGIILSRKRSKVNGKQAAQVRSLSAFILPA